MFHILCEVGGDLKVCIQDLLTFGVFYNFVSISEGAFMS